jgi:hypothetical protein
VSRALSRWAISYIRERFEKEWLDYQHPPEVRWRLLRRIRSDSAARLKFFAAQYRVNF